MNQTSWHATDKIPCFNSTIISEVVLHYILDIYTSIMVHFLTNRETLSQPLQSLLHTVKPEKDSGMQLIHHLQTPWDGTNTFS
jgi:hypothetical protein